MNTPVKFIKVTNTIEGLKQLIPEPLHGFCHHLPVEGEKFSFCVEDPITKTRISMVTSPVSKVDRTTERDVMFSTQHSHYSIEMLGEGKL